MIRTFIFFDLETTGLIQRNVMPNITEMSLVAVTRNNLLDTVDDLPRVLHKLLLPVHPKLKISRTAESFTHLSNGNLKDTQCFDKGTYNLMKCFLNKLADPICFVAHNGIKFDYPILMNEIEHINETFSDNILCIDTLHLFKEFFNQNIKCEKDAKTVPSGSTSSSYSVHEDFHYLLNDGYDNELVAALDLVMAKSCTHKTDVLSEPKNHDKPCHDITRSTGDEQGSHDQFSPNSKTPPGKFCSKMQAINEKTPEAQMIKSDSVHTHPPYRKGRQVRRKLNYMDCKPPNFKLGTLYTHMLGETAKQLHSAEGDCLSMLRCAVKISTFFVEWADLNAVPLVSCKNQ